MAIAKLTVAQTAPALLQKSLKLLAVFELPPAYPTQLNAQERNSRVALEILLRERSGVALFNDLGVLLEPHAVGSRYLIRMSPVIQLYR